MKNKSMKKQPIDARKAIGTATIVVSAFLLFCLITGRTILGVVGGAVADFFLGLFGITAYALMLAILIVGVMVLCGRKITLPKLQVANFAVMFFAVILLVHLMTSQRSVSANDYGAYLSACYNYATMSTFGGAFAGLFVWPLCNAITVFGTYIFIIALLILTAFICAEYFFKLSKIKFERNEEFITEETHIEPQFPGNKLFVATINESRPQRQQAPEPQTVVSPKPTRDPLDELYGVSREASAPTTYNSVERPAARKSPMDELYGDFLKKDAASDDFYASFGSMPAPRRTPDTSYTRDYESRYSAPKSVENISSAPISKFNGAFEEPPAILHGDDQYTSDTLTNIPKTDEFLEEIKSDKKDVNKESAKKDLYALKGQMKPDTSLPPIVNGDEFSEQLKKKAKYEETAAQTSADTFAPRSKPSSPVFTTPSVEQTLNHAQRQDNEIKEDVASAGKEPETISTPAFIKVDKEPVKDVSFVENAEMPRAETAEPIFEQDLLSDDELKDISIAEAITEPKEEAVSVATPEVGFVEKPFSQFNSKTEEKGFQVGLAAVVGKKEEEQPKPVHKYEKYVPPSLQLLDDAVFDPSVATDDYDAIGKNIERTLAQFKVDATFVNYVHGPTVTRYEFEMAPGISVKRVASLADDIAMVVASKSSVRIEAPIPGKSLFGIEVPNKKVAKVPLRSILESPEFQNTSKGLTFALGIDIGGQKIVSDLADMPHLLIAGSTGSGKSVCVNSLIISMLYKYSPEELRFILVDPKQVEFTLYNKMPHLMINEIICEPEKAISVFNWLIKEMERRFTMFAEYGVREIEGYNKAIDTETTQKLPRIVMVVDEVADLMQYNKSEIEQRIQKLAQKARAAGIHLVLATQRPSVDVITGVIKANFPARIALRVSSAADARTIMQQGGPEKLIAKGDMLFQAGNMPEPIRLQGALVLDDEVREVVNFIAANNESYFDEDVKNAIFNAKKGNAAGGGSDDDDLDDLFYDALKYVIETGMASISMLQRRFSIGYNRAGRLIQDMEEKHFVSPFEGAKPRQVLITEEEYNQLFGN